MKGSQTFKASRGEVVCNVCLWCITDSTPFINIYAFTYGTTDRVMSVLWDGEQQTEHTRYMYTQKTNVSNHKETISFFQSPAS